MALSMEADISQFTILTPEATGVAKSNTLGATARSYRRQDGADAAARFEKVLPARASLRPPIFLKFATD